MSEKYEVTTKEIGRGSSSSVVEGFVIATNPLETKRRVIVKIIKGGGKSPKIMDMVEKEVGTLRALEHPSIPTVIDYYFENKDAYIVENFIDGETLESVMQENSFTAPAKTESIPLPGVISLTFSLTSALDYVHSRNIVHRWVHPMILDFRIVLTTNTHFLLVETET